MALLIKTDGTQEIVVPSNGKEFDWEREIYPRIGGYVEILAYKDNSKAIVLDEEGKLKGYEYNHLATELAREKTYLGNRDFLVGDVMVCSLEELGD